MGPCSMAQLTIKAWRIYWVTHIPGLVYIALWYIKLSADFLVICEQASCKLARAHAHAGANLEFHEMQ